MKQGGDIGRRIAYYMLDGVKGIPLKKEEGGK